MQTMRASSSLRAQQAARPALAKRSASLVVKSQMDNKEMPPAAEPVMAGATSPSSFVLSPVQEMINGRAAMMGFVSAVVAEVATGHSVWSQVAGKYVDQELVEPALGLSDVGFGAIVVLTTLATFAPKVMDMSEAEMKTKSFGLLTPEKELLNGRAAMMGIVALLVVEAVKGSALF